MNGGIKMPKRVALPTQTVSMATERVRQLLQSHSLLAIEVPTLTNQRMATQLIEQSIAQGVLPAEIRRQTRQHLTGLRYE